MKLETYKKVDYVLYTGRLTFTIKQGYVNVLVKENLLCYQNLHKCTALKLLSSRL